jgi:hypothetical protein
LHIFFLNYLEVLLDELQSLDGSDEVLLVQILLVGHLLFALWHFSDKTSEST